MVCPAPQFCNSGGRSADNRKSGIPEWLASVTAGNQLASAEPEVHKRAVGDFVRLLKPKAMNPAERSSNIGVHSIRS